MGISQTEEKKAVTSGYWNLFRYDPRRADEGQNPFVLDSKEPTGEYKEFALNEVRYSALMRRNPERSEKLLDQAAATAKEKYENLVKRAKAE